VRIFADRQALRLAGLHRQIQAGISGNDRDGADAIVLSGGYEDDEDHGDLIVYTGQGGNQGGHQVQNQEFTRGNKALAVSMTNGLPIRVIRGYQHKSEWSPSSGHRYAGLYAVEDHWTVVGKSGHLVHRYQLRKLASYKSGAKDAEDAPQRKDVMASRIIRDTAITRRLKDMYGYRCQVCDTLIETPAGYYAEAAHVKPLGRPHNGPDTMANVICLCPNHHVQFDYGTFSVRDNMALIGLNGQLIIHPEHDIDISFFQYHREHYGFGLK